MRDPHEVLGVARDASIDEVRAAYDALAERYAADRAPHTSEGERRDAEIRRAELHVALRALSEVRPEPSEELPWSAPAPVRLRAGDIAVLVLIVLGAGITMFARLGEPGKRLPAGAEECKDNPPLGDRCFELIPLDEVHYVPDARDVIRFGTESDTRVQKDSSYVVHPPVGKWFIAAGIKIFGDRPFGWRAFGALFGALSIIAMYFLALRLWRSPWWAAAAALLLAVDGLWFVLARVAMLDIYAAAFTLTGLWLLVEDRDRSAPGARGVRWWRLAAAASFAIAIATKWQVAPMIAVAVGMSAAWDAVKRRRAGISRRPGAALRLAGTFLLLPATLYVATYTPWFIDAHRYHPPRCAAEDRTLLFKAGVPGQWVCYQLEMLDFHRHLAKYDKGEPAHPYFGNGYGWPWLGRPVAHHYATLNEGSDDERRVHVLGLPNPLIWWPAFFLGVPLLIFWSFRRDPTARALLVLFASGFAPYLIFDLIRRPVFLFYAAPLVPVLVLIVVHVLQRATAAHRWVSPYVIGYLALAALAFAYFYPVLAASPLAPGGFWGWLGRMWLNYDCAAADAIKQLCWI